MKFGKNGYKFRTGAWGHFGSFCSPWVAFISSTISSKIPWTLISVWIWGVAGLISDSIGADWCWMGRGVGEDGLIFVSVTIVGKWCVCSVDIVEEEEEDPKWIVKTRNGGVCRWGGGGRKKKEEKKKGKEKKSKSKRVNSHFIVKKEVQGTHKQLTPN